MNLGRRFWRDERGNVSVSSMLLLVVIVAIGAVVGLNTFRDQLVQQFGDVATALDHLDQSFSGGPLGTYVDDPNTLGFEDMATMAPACQGFVAPSGESP
jgi:Flp pilus assembly pilin Flp